jgi:tRNA-splicing ligase RtcB
MPRNERVYRALARDGLAVSYDGHSVYTVRLSDDPEAVTAEVLLPESLPLESKALKQLAELAAVRHPDGGKVCRACATPDFHPGDSGIAIGSVVETDDIIIPAAIGVDICCGMRFHTVDMSIDTFLSRKDAFVAKMKGDYLLGTRDVEMSSEAMREMFRNGLPSWIQAVRRNPRGCMTRTDLDMIELELDNVMYRGSLQGDVSWAPEGLAPLEGAVRDDGLGTIGRGNHFVEVQLVEEVVDRQKAFEWGVKAGQIAFMVHTGSRNVGRYVGGLWQDKARDAWPKGVKHPASKIFPITSRSELFEQYVTAEHTAGNYGFVNRALLAELLRIRVREVYGDVDAPLIYDLPHNLTAFEHGKWVSRKGACPAHPGQAVIIPGSMGAPSYLLVGNGSDRFINSASHGAGRAASRTNMGRFVRDEKHLEELGLKGVECITLREERRVEESPAAYKPIGPIIASQVAAGSVSVVAKMRPILTFKA